MSRFLVVDDVPDNIRRVIQALTDAGVQRESIDVAQNILDAQRKLEEESYALMVLDLALPIRPEDPPLREGGIKLLDDIARSERFHRPLQIVGLTSFDDLKDELEDRFSRHLTVLFHRERANDSWLHGIQNIAKYLLRRDNPTDRARFDRDLCVVTALRQPELRAVRNLKWAWQDVQMLDDVTPYFEGHFDSEDRRFSVVAASASRMGMVPSALLTQKMILRFRPRVLAMVGICAGVKAKTNAGDVLLADPAWDYQSGKWINDGDQKRFELDPDHLDVPQEITRRFEQLIDDSSFWHTMWDQWPAEKPATIPQGRIGPVGSGSAVVADAEFARQVKEQHRRLTGIEMEVYGVYSAVKSVGPPFPLVFALKSVCDFADDQKNDAYQAFASYASAQTLAEFAGRYMPELCRQMES